MVKKNNQDSAVKKALELLNVSLRATITGKMELKKAERIFCFCDKSSTINNITKGTNCNCVSAGGKFVLLAKKAFIFTSPSK